MPDWTTCPHCQLKHSLRGDGLCPRCQQPTGAAGDAGGAAESAGMPPPLSPAPGALPPMRHPRSGLSAGRIALVVVAVLVILGLKVLGSISGRQLLFKSMFELSDEPVSSIDGRELGYHLTLAGGDKWYLRDPADAAKDNPDADRWVVCPDRNAHIVIVVEEIELGPGEEIDLEAMVDFALQTTRANAEQLTVVDKTPLWEPAKGRLLHTTSVVDGIDIESFHALYVDGPRAYQVLAFTEKKNFQGMRSQLEQVIRSLRLPGS